MHDIGIHTSVRDTTKRFNEYGIFTNTFAHAPNIQLEYRILSFFSGN